MLSWVRWCAVIVLKQKTAYEMRISDWSSDVCSSDLSDRRQHIEKFGETHRRVDQPRDLRIGRIDQKIFVGGVCARSVADAEMRGGDRHGRRGERSEEHTSELQSLMRISYAVFCLKKKKLKVVVTRYT